MRDHSRRSRAVSALGLLLAACLSPSDASPPALELPASSAPAEDLATWWTRFQDPQLDALIAHALEHNQDLAIAAARVLEAAALVRNADDWLPDANFSASAGRNETSDKNAFPRFAGIDRDNSAHAASVDITWELDLWGRIRAAHDAALADLLQNRENLHGARAAIAAQTAQSYFRLVAIDLRLRLSEDTLQNRRDVQRIQQRRLALGTGTPLEAHQAEADAEAVASLLPRLHQAQTSAARALLLLTGEQPAALQSPALQRRADLPSPPPVPPDLPSDLLARRPDIRAAEAALAAASARVDEARARYFPTIRLTGSIGQQSESLTDLFVSPATVWAFAASIFQPLTGLREIDAQHDAAQARRLQAEAGYVRTVQTAFAEAYDAIGTRAASHDTLTAQQRRIDALQNAERVATARHDAGAGSFLDLLDARRDLLTVRQERIDTAADELVATVDVYRALGGGWSEAAPAPAGASGGGSDGASR